MFLQLTHSSLCALYEKNRNEFKAHTGNKKVKIARHGDLFNLVTVDSPIDSGVLNKETAEKTKKDKSKIEVRSNTVLCDICENGKITVVQKRNKFYILPDFMNTIPISLYRMNTKEHIVRIGSQIEEISIFNSCSEENRNNLDGTEQCRPIASEIVEKDKAVVVEQECSYTLDKKCIHTHECPVEVGETCAYKDTMYYLEHLLHCALIKIAENTKDLFLSFSGGIDSLLCATLCCEYFADRKIYLINTCFSKNGVFISRDRQSALEFYDKIVSKYGNNCILVENNIHRTEILQNQDTITKISRETTMDFNLAALHYFTAHKAKEFNASSIITGTGGDELFMGYLRHRETLSDKTLSKSILDAKLQSIIKEDINAFWKTNLHRDYTAGSILSVIPVSPFLDPFVFEYSMQAAGSAGVKKKELTDILGRKYPGSVFKKKLAGQYGSGIADVIRSIKCRAPSMCKNNECLSLECTRKAE